VGSQRLAIVFFALLCPALLACDDTEWSNGHRGVATDPEADPAGHHPAGFADPLVHGLEAKLHEQSCTDCHGADLGGGTALSCDSCHPTGWRTDCTFCHGSAEEGSGAPPVSIRGEPEDSSFGVHARHVQENTHSAYGCEQCHRSPADALSEGHLFDSSPGQAEVDFQAGLSPTASWSAEALSCSNLYCHGDGQGDNGAVEVAQAPLSCASCHPDLSSGQTAWDLMTGRHVAHLGREASCEDCHGETTADGLSILSPTLHVNGSKDLAFSTSDMRWNGNRSCTGTCHGTEHSNRPWDH